MDNNLFSIDKLVEFGLGISIAQQMVKVMNETMQTMYVPGSPNNIMVSRQVSIYVVIEGKPIGPMSEKDFSVLVMEQKVTKDSLVWIPGMSAWKKVQEAPEILRIIALTPPPIPKVQL